jgi:hypothetical protein
MPEKDGTATSPYRTSERRVTAGAKSPTKRRESEQDEPKSCFYTEQDHPDAGRTGD